MLDIFNTDAFGVVTMTEAINKAPYQPGRIGALALFREKGISTTTVAIEDRDGQLTLIQTSPRGGIGSSIGPVKRRTRAFPVPHLERNAMVMADEVQNVRAFGSEDQLLAVQTVVNDRLETLRAMHEVTLEHMRAGAIQGLVLDADGSELFNLFDEFEVSQQVAVLSPDSAADAGDALRQQVVDATRLVEDELGNEPVSGYRAFAGRGFIDAMRGDVSIVQTLRYADPRALLQVEQNNRVFEFGGVTWEEYRGSIAPGPTAADPDPDRVPFFADDEAYLFPVGPQIFRTYFAPADFNETVNTLGLPVYAKQAVDPEFQRWTKIHSQSNPLVLCVRPSAVVKLTLAT